MNYFEQGMHKNDANFVPLTPISFLDRIKDVYPDYEAIVYKERKYSWRQVYDRCTRFASALTKVGIGLKKKIDKYQKIMSIDEKKNTKDIIKNIPNIKKNKFLIFSNKLKFISP